MTRLEQGELPTDAPSRDRPRERGRPRDPALHRRILEAAAAVMLERGVGGTTLTAVAARAGVARATVYLRWPSRDALLGAVTKSSMGGLPFPIEGDIEHDIRVGTAFAQRVMGAPQFRSILPELVRAVLARPPEVPFDALAPNRELLAREYAELAEASGFDPRVEPRLPFDLLFGAALAHLLATGTGPSREYARQLADVIVAGLRRPDGSGA